MPAVDLAKFEMRQANTIEALKMVSKIEAVKVVYPSERLCPESSCKVVVNKKPLYVDDDHLSNFGVDVILPAILSAMRASKKATK